jgi:hypothetical protein
MYKLKIKHLNTGEIKELTFNTEEELELYKNYHIVFYGWDRPQKWVLERFLKEEERKYIAASQERIGQNKKPQTWYLVKPEYNFVDEKHIEDKVLYDWEVLRQKRDFVLSMTDYTQLADCPFSSKIKQLYREYRSFLRNLPLCYSDETIDKAKVMTFEEWAQFYGKNIDERKTT